MKKIKNLINILLRIVLPVRNLSKRNKRLLSISSFVLILILIPLAAYTLTHLRFAEAAWFNTNWSFRQRVDITNSGSAQTDFQVSFTLDTSTLVTNGKLRSDCNDIRVTDINGKILPHWIEKLASSACNTTTTKVWTKIPSISTTGNTLYVYYGNPQASSTQNGKKVFEYFGDFDNGLDGIFTEADPAGEITVSGGKLVFSGGASGPWDQGVYLTNSITRGDMAMEFDYQWTSNNVSWDAFMFGWKDDGAGASYANLVYGYYNPSGDTCTTCAAAVYEDGGNIGGITGNWVKDTNYKARVRMRASGGAYYDMSSDGGINWTNSYTSTYSTESNLHPGWMLYSGDHNVDNFFVRKDTATPPSVAAPTNEENGPGSVAYWKFDEGTGTTTTDSSSNKYVGTLTNMSATPATNSGWMTEDKCIKGKCLAFDGGNDLVNMGNVFDIGTNIPVTVAAWVNVPATLPGSYWGHGVITKGGFNWVKGYALLIRGNNDSVSAGKAEFTVETGGVSNGVELIAGPDLRGTGWHYIVGVRDPSTNFIGLYVDGVLVASATSATYADADLINPSYNFNIGYAPTTVGQYFAGKIDGPKIYKYARTVAQIQVDYNQGAGSVLGISDANKNLTNGLVGNWKMDEATWSGTLSEVLDSSGNGNNGQAEGAAGGKAFASPSAKFGNGGFFDGVDDDVVIPDSTSLDLTNNITISFWAKPGSSQKSYTDILSKHSSGTAAYVIEQYSTNTNQYGFAWGNGSAFTCNSASDVVTLTANAWQHVVFQKSGNTVSYFVNGTKTGSCTGAFSTIATNNDPVYISRWSAGGGRQWNGTLDELRIYNRALSPAEVEQLYNFAPGPVAYYDFEKKQGTTVNDSSGYGNNATIVGSPAWTNGKYGSGLNTGITGSDYVNSPTVDLPTGEWTAMAWFKYPLTSTGASWHTLFRGAGGDHQIIVERGGMQLGVYDNAGVAFVGCGFIMSTLSNGWHHITTVGVGSVQKFYIDGVYKCQSAFKSTTDIYAIGNYQSGPQNWGQIDEAKIYNYARTPGQIVEDMNGGHPAPGSPVGSPVVHFKFDDGFGNVATSSGNISNVSAGLYNLALPATANSGWNQNGKFGKALVFDGINDRVAMTGRDGINFNQDDSFTVSAWVKRSVTGVNQYVLNKQQNVTNEFTFTLDIFSSDKARFLVGKQNVSAQIATGTTSLSANTWYFLTGTYDGTNIKIYVNGKLDGTATRTFTSATQSLADFHIGQFYNNTLYFNGLIDEVKIYNGTLSPSQIQLDYNRGSSMVLGSLSDTSGLTGGSVASNSANAEYCVPGDTASCAPPIGRWDFEKGQGNVANDISGNNYFGAITGGANFVSGKKGKALNFDAIDDIVTISGMADGVFTGSYTQSLWINTTTNSNLAVLEKGSNNALIQTLSGGQIRAGPAATGNSFLDTLGTPLINDGKWHYVAVTYDASINDLYVYIDGVKRGGKTTANDAASSATAFTLGARSGPSVGFPGKLDDVRIYNYVRTPAQVAWEYNKGAPVGHWKLDECQGSTIYDSSGNNNHGTWNGASTGSITTPGTCSTTGTGWGTNSGAGKFNYAMNFDGTNDYIDIPDNNILDASLSAQMTISTWVYATVSAVTNFVPVGKEGGGPSYRYTLNGTSGHFAIATTGNGWYTAGTTANFGTLDLNRWNHIVATYDGSYLRTYTNGKYSGIGASSISGNIYNGTGGLRFGSSSAGNIDYLNGRVDDVKLFNYALTQAQIRTLYNNGAVIFGPASGAP